MKKPKIILMLKAPVAGKVKTRLGTQLGAERACLIYRWLVEQQMREIPCGWQVHVFFDPASALGVMRAWLGEGHEYTAQRQGDLGQRLIQAGEEAFSVSDESLVFLGGDCPYVTTAILKQAGELLKLKQVVLGPSSDGGYYLIALNEVVFALFEGIEWSTERVLSQTIKKCEANGLTYGLLPELEDIDEADSWERAQKYFSLNL